MQHATIERDILRDHLAGHPARRFLKFRGRTDRQSVGGTSFAELNAQALKTGAKGKHLDTMLSESGYATFEDLDESVEEYFNSKQQLADVQQTLNGLRTENSYATKYHRALGTADNQESITREIIEPPLRVRKAPRPAIRKVPRPAGGLRVGKIRRLKPRTRDFINRRAARQRLVQEAEDNLDDMRDLRRAGYDVYELRAADTQYRRTHKLAFGRTLKVRKK